MTSPDLTETRTNRPRYLRIDTPDGRRRYRGPIQAHLAEQAAGAERKTGAKVHIVKPESASGDIHRWAQCAKAGQPYLPK